MPDFAKIEASTVKAEDAVRQMVDAVRLYRAGKVNVVAVNETVEVAAQANGVSGDFITNIDYYFAYQGGAWSSATNLATNGSDWSQNEENVVFAIGNSDVATDSDVRIYGANYTR